MIGKKRPSVVLGSFSDNTSEPHLIGSLTKCRKPVSHRGKENIPPCSVSGEINGGVSEAFPRTVGGRCPLVQTQIKHRPLSHLDSISAIGNTGLELDETCVSSGLDELDSEIFGSSGLAELDAETLETIGSYGESSVCGSTSKSPCEPDYKKLDCGSHGVGSRESHSIESRLLSSLSDRNGDREGGDGSGIDDEDLDVEDDQGDFESTQFDVLMKLCADEDELEPGPMLDCPLCGIDISEMNEESRQFHANECIDKSVSPKEYSSNDVRKQSLQSSYRPSQSSAKPESEAPVLKWLQSLGLVKYETAFTKQEIDWESLQFLTEEDLITMGIAALGPRKKIMQSIKELKERENILTEKENGGTENAVDAAKNTSTNKLITDFFSCPSSHKEKNLTSSGQQLKEKAKPDSRQRKVTVRKAVKGKSKDVPPWCSIPGTPFRVDAFRYLRRDCSHWFLTHFHIDHYQGLAKSFAYGTIYCSMITARLINTKIGISWDRLHIMPLNQKIDIAGVNVTCYDANHCPGAIIILFEPPNGEAVLHTGDFRFNEEMAKTPGLQTCRIHTLILDTTYCKPEYNFPKQEVVMQFVIEAIQAESFNPKTLFLIGSYTIGKERLFLEVARVLQRKIYVPVAKLRLLECLGLPAEDIRWFTLNENESNIHVVPMWTIASFKRLKQLSYQYAQRFSLIVAFSPTGWSLGKGKKSAGRKRQQGTIIRYEVPYSEHSSFEELKEFVNLVSPVKIIPSVNNEDEASSNAMVELLLSEFSSRNLWCEGATTCHLTRPRKSY